MVGIVTAIAAALEISVGALLFNAAMFVVSTIMQQNAAAEARDRQRRQQEEADARADAAKGISIVTEGEVTTLRVVYGRNLIGGARVYHNTLHSYTYAAPAIGGVAFSAADTLASSIGGSKHEFLITQQALCFSGINACYDIDIDEKKLRGEYVDSNNEVVYNPVITTVTVPATGYWGFGGGGVDNMEFIPEWRETAPAYTYESPPPGVRHVANYDYGLRIHVYPNGNVADPLMTANDSSRSSAVFTNTAFATCVYRLNRDDPQFGGVPSAQFYVEGMKIRTISKSTGVAVLSTDRIYSNNSALCLLDYLMSPVYGRGLSEDQIDLDSFYKGSLICGKIVQPNVPLAGSLWYAKDESHDVYLYECNLALDSGEEIRKNIELILETMAGAELVWSAGKYKLQLSYPAVYTATPVTSYSEGDVVQYTSLDDVRLFRALTNASNATVPVIGAVWEDAIDFYITDDDIVRDGENSIAWPNAQSRYNNAVVRFLNEALDFKEDTVSWPGKNGYVDGPGIDKGTWSAVAAYDTSDLVTYMSVQYQLINGKARISATVPTSDPMWVVYGMNPVYAQFLEEDNGLQLETSIFATGVTSSYNALAKAEQIVRTSRLNVTYDVIVDHNYVAAEPGDTVKLTSQVLYIPGDLLKISSVTPQDNGTLKLSLSKFDANALAYNVKDNEVIPIRNLYDPKIDAVTNLEFIPDNTSLNIGTVSWDASEDNRVIGYHVMYKRPTDSSWLQLASVSGNTVPFPSVGSQIVDIAVVPFTATNREVNPARWAIIGVLTTNTSIVTNLDVSLKYSGVQITFDKANDPKQYEYEFREGGTSWSTATHVGVTNANVYDIGYRAIGEVTLWVRCKNIYGTLSSEIVTKTFNIVNPPAPSNFIINGGVFRWQAQTSPTYYYPISGYRLRIHEGYNQNWNSAADLSTGTITESPFSSPVSISGERTVMIKSVDCFDNESVSSTDILYNFGDIDVSNVVETFQIDPVFAGEQTGCSVVSNELIANELDSFYDTDLQSLFTDDTAPFFEPASYAGMTFETDEFVIDGVMSGSLASVQIVGTGIDTVISYRESLPFYSTDADSLYGSDSDPMYERNPDVHRVFGSWSLSSGGYSIIVEKGAGADRATISELSLIVDVPDMVEYLEDLPISSAGTTLPLTKPFTKIKTIIATLQSNGSGAVRVEVNKAINLSPVITAYNSASVAVDGALADIQIKGY